MITALRNYFAYRKAVRQAEQRKQSMAFLRSFYRDVAPVDSMSDAEVEQLWKDACVRLNAMGITAEELGAVRI